MNIAHAAFCRNLIALVLCWHLVPALRAQTVTLGPEENVVNPGLSSLDFMLIPDGHLPVLDNSANGGGDQWFWTHWRVIINDLASQNYSLSPTSVVLPNGTGTWPSVIDDKGCWLARFACALRKDLLSALLEEMHEDLKLRNGLDGGRHAVFNEGNLSIQGDSR